MSKATPAIKRRQLVDDVIAHLEAAIAAGRYQVGARLPAEPELTAELGVGRSTLREAVRALAHGGVLEVRQGAGTFVLAAPALGEPLSRRLQRARLREVQEVRRALELETARLAAERHSADDLRQMRAALAERQRALERGDAAAALDADIAFHEAIAVATGNSVLADLYRAFSAILRPALAELWSEPGGGSAAGSLHEELLTAIVAGDGPSAVAATERLLNRHKGQF